MLYVYGMNGPPEVIYIEPARALGLLAPSAYQR